MGKFNQDETVKKAVQFVEAQKEHCDERVIDVKEAIDWFYYDLLNWCGCGNPYVALTVVRDYLSLVNYFAEQKVEESQSYTHKDYEDECAYCHKKFGCKTIYDNPLLLCLAYTMDDKNLTEHGSAIGGAWLTEMGEMFLALLRTDEFERWGE